MLKDLMDKLPRSSEDSRNISLTVKSALSYVIPVAVVVIQLTGATTVDSAQLQVIVDNMEMLTFYTSMAISTVFLIWGGVRRIWNSIK